MRPCLHPNTELPTEGVEYVSGACRFCWLFVNRDGYRQLWSRTRSFPCLHEGSILEYCKTMTGDEAELRHVRDCDLHDRCTRAPVGKTVQSCSSCPDYQSTTPMVFDHGGNGMGDALLGLLAVAGWQRENPGVPVTYRVGGNAMQFAELFHGYDELGVHARDHNTQPTEGATQLNIGWDAEWNSKFHTSAMWERYCRNAGTRQWHIPALRNPDRIRSLGQGYAGCIVLAPFSLWNGREWPLGNWIELERSLSEDGYRTVVVHSSLDRCDGFQGMLACGLPAERTAGIMLNAAVVIGNDSGPAHLAGILGTPTLAIVGDYPGDRLYGAYPRVKSVQEGGHLTGVSVQRVRREVHAIVRPPRSTIPATLPDLLALMEEKLSNHTTAWGLADRGRTMGWLFREMNQRFPNGANIVETGCIRERDDWSAGYSTWLFGCYLTITGKGSLTTVDIDGGHLATARELCSELQRIEFVEQDSVAFLQERKEPIAVAFLDSLDTYSHGHAEHGLAEAQAVVDKMAPNGLIVFDDTPSDGHGGWHGKGRLAVEWLIQQGWKVAPISSYQTVMVRS